jgi:hypothetical protein
MQAQITHTNALLFIQHCELCQSDECSAEPLTLELFGRAFSQLRRDLHICTRCIFELFESREVTIQ